MKPLEGIRVVEMGTHVAAPVAARLMADWGADVIKVESIKGESYRTVGVAWKMPNKEDNNPILQPGNANKRSLSLDLKNPEGKEALLKLLETADVFLTNTRPQALERLGLDYEKVKERCPRLVYALFTAFGLEGPDRDAPGFDSASYWARGGMLPDWTPAEYTPGRPHPGFGDATVASVVLAGVLSCLLKREKTGKGDFVTGSLYGTALWYNFHGIVEAQYPGHDMPISRYQVVRPLTPVYKSADDKFFFIVEQQWEEKATAFFTMLGMDEIAHDPQFTIVAESQKCMKECVDYLDQAFAKVPYEKIDKVCSELNMVHSSISTCKDALEDPQAWENGYLRKIQLENGDSLTVPATPVCFGSQEQAQVALAPHLGADSREILKELGYEEARIDQMTEAGIVNTHGK